MALTELYLLISESKVIIIVTLLVVLFTAVIIMAIMCEYRYYQTDHKERQYNFAAFIKQVQFYLYLLLFFLLMIGIEIYSQC